MTSGFPRIFSNSCYVMTNFGCRQSILQALHRILSSQNSLPSLPIVKEFHGAAGDMICPATLEGVDHLRCPRLNKGLAFTFKERQLLGLHGLMPPSFRSQEDQVELCRVTCERYRDDLNKYVYLTELQDRNERLFYRLLTENVAKLMPIVYTPTVGLACQKFGVMYRRPRGLFITIHDKGHVLDIIKNWPIDCVRAIVVTDGERILGLGDLGANGMGIPVGKLALYTALAGIPPHQCLPITLDVGTNNQGLLDDPLYIGLRHKRVSGAQYEEFVDEFMAAVVKRYGQNTLIQFEDFGNHHAFRLLARYRYKYCTFNDDIQGTASVVVAGLLASERITGKKISEHTIVFLGAGEAAIGIANLSVRAMQKEGLSKPDARNKIWMMDIDGLLAKDRPEGNLSGPKSFYVKDHIPTKSLGQIIKEIKPSVIIGVSAATGAFTPDILKAMASFNERPIVFALSNPTNKAECTAEEAYTHTDGRCVFSSGSPFPPVNYKGKMFKPGQGNNAYIFPGVALGVIATEIHHIKEAIFLIAAEVIAREVSDSDLEQGSVYPPLSLIKNCSIKIAIRIAEYAYEKGLASIYPEPENKKTLIESSLYNYYYTDSLPPSWPYPKFPEVKGTKIESVGVYSEKVDRH